MAKTRKLSPALKAWNVHWKKVRAEMEKKGTFKKGDNLTKVFKEAKKSFKSHKKGGADKTDEKVDTPVPIPDVPGPAPDGEASPIGGRGKRKTRRGKGRMY
jgi:hypothetical protein